jgi:hypothetical protein
MKLRKLFVILLALLVVFSFVACDGSGGGSNDNGGNGGGDADPPAVTWPVSYQINLHVLFPDEIPEGGFGYVDFYGNGTYQAGEGLGEVKYPADTGTYTGDDPHGDGTVYVTGTWEGSSVTNEPKTITAGMIVFNGTNLTRQDD